MKAYLAQCGVRELLVAAADEREAADTIEAAGGPSRCELLDEAGLVEALHPDVLAQAAQAPLRVLSRPVWARRRRYKPLPTSAAPIAA